MYPRKWRELPPTGGLPLRWGDLGATTSSALAPLLAEQVGTTDAQLTCSGTAALVVALTMLASMSDRREVIVPGFTCPLVALAVAHCGLTLRLCDLRPGHFDLDPRALALLCGAETLAVVVTHLAGRVADIETSSAIAERAGAWVIEDAAQALGARYADGTSVGLAGDIGFFSLAAGKGLTIYEGGLLVSRHVHLRAAMHTVAANVQPPNRLLEWRRCAQLLGYAALYRPNLLRLPYGNPLRRALGQGDIAGAIGDLFPRRIPLHRVGAWRQSVGARASARLPDLIDAMRAQAAVRVPLLRQIEGMSVLDDIALASGVWPFLVVILPNSGVRDAVLDRLWCAGLGVSRLFASALSDYEFLRDLVPADSVANARDFAARTLTITNSPWLDDDSFTRILEELRAACHAAHA